VRDSWRIYKVILGSFFRFMASSLTCVVIDHGIFNLLNLAVFGNGARKEAQLILAATVIARIVSGTVNFLLNRKLVFRQKGNGGRTFLRYILLSALVMLLSAGGTWLLSQLMPTALAKVIAETLLYFLSYRMQQNWVFREEQSDAENA